MTFVECLPFIVGYIIEDSDDMKGVAMSRPHFLANLKLI